MKNGRVAMINVGASAFRMHVAEFENGVQKELDFLIMPLRLGVDTFSQGYISLENVQKSVDILKMFKLKLKEYDVTDYKAYCTSGVREARNNDFFLDYVKRHSGIDIEFLDSEDEVYIKYVGAKNSVENFEHYEKKGLIFANVSTGNITLNITRSGKYIYSGTLPYGSMLLRQMFNSLSHLKRHKAVEEYVEVMLKNIITVLPAGIRLEYLVGAGSSINLMKRVYDIRDNTIHKEQLEDLYYRICSMSLNEIMDDLGLRQDEALVLMPTLVIYLKLMDLVVSDHFVFSSLTFPHILSMYHMDVFNQTRSHIRLRNNLITIAQRYRSDTQHLKWVYGFAKEIFNSLYVLHALDSYYLNVLAASVMLNDVGRYMADSKMAENSYFIIRSLSIPGIDPRIIELAAWVVYEANSISTSIKPQEYSYFDSSDRLAISKLAGIHKVAGTLDAGRKKRIKSIDVTISDIVTIQAHCEAEPYLEMYEFDRQKHLFIDIFGVHLEMRVRMRYD